MQSENRCWRDSRHTLRNTLRSILRNTVPSTRLLNTLLQVDTLLLVLIHSLKCRKEELLQAA